MPELSEQERVRALSDAYSMILDLSGLGRSRHDDGLIKTPLRAAKGWAELTSGYGVDIGSLFTVFDGEGYDEMVALADIPFSSLCEHHLLPFMGTASIAYLPQGKIIGVSKLARLVEAYSRRLQNQERMTQQIARALVDHLDPIGVLVWVEAHHTCMSARGVKSQGFMRTSFTNGAMRDRAETRAEAMTLIGRRA